MYNMQSQSLRLSRLRQKLARLKDMPAPLLAPFLDRSPMIKGTLYPLRRKCAKPYCRCARGPLHETMVLSASVSGKTRLWTVPQERIEAMHQMTEQYRRFRQARAELVKLYARHSSQMLRLIDAIERLRRKEP